MDEMLLTLDKIKELISILGYDLKLAPNSIPMFESISIKKGKQKVGSLSIESKNLYFMNLDNIPVENLNLKRMKFSKNKEKNMKDLVHFYISDNGTEFDCYNAILDKGLDQKVKFVKISNDKFALRCYSYGINVTIKELNKKYFVFNSGSNITVRENNNIFSDIMIAEDSYYDVQELERIMDEVYDYTGFDIINNSIKLYQNEIQKSYGKTYTKDLRGD